MTQNNERTQRFTIIANNPVLTEDRYTSVEFCIKDLEFNYQFKIWETKTPELNILINRNAIIMKHLHVGNTVDIKCIPSGGSRYPVTMRTKIKHINDNVEKRLKGFCLVGLVEEPEKSQTTHLIFENGKFRISSN